MGLTMSSMTSVKSDNQPWKLENLNIGKNKPQNVKNEGMEQNYEFESEASFSNRNKCEHKH